MKSLVRRGKNSNAFTLTELLVVISIIGLLVGLAATAIPKALDAGDKAKAKGDLTAIVAACKAYRNEYGNLPIVPSQVGGSGWDQGSFGGAGDKTLYKKFMNMLGGDSSVDFESRVMNPKGVRFLENMKTDKEGLVVDPWGSPYFIKMDCDDSGGVNYYFNPGTVENIRLQVIVVSMGKNMTLEDPDKKLTPTCDDVLSWR